MPMSSTSRGFLASPEGLELLQAAKAERGWTFAAIAEQAGVSADTVSRLFHPEWGKRVSEESVSAIAGVLGVEVDAIGSAGAWRNPLVEAENRIQEALQSGGVSKLDLSGLNLTELPKSINQFTYLTQLDLSRNRLKKIPKELFGISNLMTLDFSQNQLTEVPKDIDRFTSLVILDLSRNQLIEISEALGQLSNLVELNLSRNKLNNLPESMFNSKNMINLSLHSNKLTEIPSSIGDFKNLSLLSLRNNQLNRLPVSVGFLKNLKELYVQNNNLTFLPEGIGELLDLRYFFANGNPLKNIPDFIFRLSGLEHLSFARAQLKKIPESIASLTQLKELFLNGNYLEYLPGEIGDLVKLTQLYLDENDLVRLPQEITNLVNLKELYLHQNLKLNIPLEILGGTCDDISEGVTPANPKDILDYYFRASTSLHHLNEAKMILVGFGAVGKTSLVNRLIHRVFEPNSKKTDGVQITQWPLRLNNAEDIKLHVWDFGGQEIMHSTHQFFLTERSLYLLVLNGRQGHEDTDAEYWLELIQSFGGDSPVIVVLNKIKEHPFDVNRGALQQKFPNIREFIATDCETGQGIDHLRAAIERETDALEHLRDPFPASWVAIKNKLSEMADNYISFEQYRAICQTDGETDYGAQDSLAVHLHSLGIALNYKDDPRLRDTHVLNPHWVTSGIYTLLNADELAETKGELEAACLSRNLDPQNYPAERHGFLLELMRKFELCFRFEEDEHRYLIPDLLDKQQPAAAAEFDPANCLNFRYQYPILPEGLLPRFIVRTHVLSEHQLRWRTGVILTFEGNRALVKADPQDRCVSISVDGPTASRRRLLAVIRSDFERIHRSFKFTPKELVPVPGHPSVTVDYKELLMREEHRQTSFDVFTGDGLLTLAVRDLLNGVDLEGTRPPTTAMERHSQALRLFFSYSHKDDLLREQLETHLKLLQRQGLIQPWHDRRILPGDDWVGEIDDNLNRADIILLLVSSDFIASDYCYDIEMKRAMERHEAGEARVIPIILRPVDWRGTPFNKLSWLPQNGEPVVQWENRDAAWLNVETGIKRVVESIKGDKRL